MLSLQGVKGVNKQSPAADFDDEMVDALDQDDKSESEEDGLNESESEDGASLSEEGGEDESSDEEDVDLDDMEVDEQGECWEGGRKSEMIFRVCVCRFWMSDRSEMDAANSKQQQGSVAGPMLCLWLGHWPVWRKHREHSSGSCTHPPLQNPCVHPPTAPPSFPPPCNVQLMHLQARPLQETGMTHQAVRRRVRVRRMTHPCQPEASTT